MNRDLPHLIGQIFNVPLMIQGQKLETILDAVGSRILAGSELGERPASEPRAAFGNTTRRFESGGYLADDGIAVLPVLGTLIRRGSWLDSASGMTSYARLSSAIVEMAADSSVRGIMMEVDSFGGEAGGVFDLAKLIRDASAAYGKPVWAVANEAAASAGYAIASAADRLWLPQMGEVGSIGVVTAHADVSGADAKAGVKWTYIFAGDHKVDGNPHAPLAAGVKAEIQADIDQIYGLFVDLIAENRGMSAEDVRATEARMFRGDRAVSAGLADEVGTFAEAMNAFAEHLDSKPGTETRRRAAVDEQRTMLMAQRQTHRSKPAAEAPQDAPETGAETGSEVVTGEDTTEGADGATGAPEGAAPAAAAAVVAAAGVPAAAHVVDAAAAERTRAAELTRISAHAAKLGVQFDLSKAIETGVQPDAARAAVLNAAADNDAATAVSTAGSVHTQRDANEAGVVRAGFDRAIDRVAERNGLKRAK